MPSTGLGHDDKLSDIVFTDGSISDVKEGICISSCFRASGIYLERCAYYCNTMCDLDSGIKKRKYCKDFKSGIHNALSFTSMVCTDFKRRAYNKLHNGSYAYSFGNTYSNEKGE